jgi:uncharacterized protein (DUF2252 family)
MLTSTAEQLAARQLELDRQRTEHFPALALRKIARMSESPFAFLRGAAPLFYEILEQHPEFTGGPEGEGWIVGDLHLENFGAFSPARPNGATPEKKAAAFNLNDFDEAVRGPFRWDVLRLLTSLILASRELGVSGPTVLDLCTALVASYVASAFRGAPAPASPAPVSVLIDRARLRPRRALLDARTVSDGARRRFVRGDRYQELPPGVREQLPKALQTYVATVMPEEAPRPEQLELIDAAYRVAGTGSLGTLRIAALTRGKGDVDTSWIFDLKEQPEASAARLVPPISLSPAVRALTAFRACVARPPRMLGTTLLGASDLLVKRLTQQEDKLALRQLEPADLPALAAYLGALVGVAHARASEGPAKTPWSKSDCFELVRRAARMASLHEAIYLEWCLLLRKSD